MISSRSDFLYVSMLFFVLFNYLKTHFAAFQCAIHRLLMYRPKTPNYLSNICREQNLNIHKAHNHLCI